MQRKAVVIAGLVLGMLLPSGRAGFAEQAVAIEQRIEAIEKADQELEQLGKQLKAATTAAKQRGLEGRIREVKAQQDQQLKALERIVGPLTASPVPSEGPTPLDERLKAQERRHETTLDNNAERRLSK